jgi:protein-S-isoprenylcysteine O-methyltransferase Ste14
MRDRSARRVEEGALHEITTPMTQNPGKLKIPWKLLLFRLLVASIVTLYSPSSIVSLHPEQVGFRFSALAVVGVILILVGIWVYLRCVWDFAFASQGDAPKTLVARGMYKFVRNPMYASLLLILLGESLLFGSWRLLGYAAAFWFSVHLLVILYEERTLVKQIGASYEQYCQEVPRWIPKLHRLAS